MKHGALRVRSAFIAPIDVIAKTILTKGRGMPMSSVAGLIEVPVGDDVKPCSVVRLGGVVRAVLMLSPEPDGTLADQLSEIFDSTRRMLQSQEWPMWLTTQTIFLRDAADQAECEARFAASGLHTTTVNHFVIQPPCNGARIAVEAWAVGGPGVKVERISGQAVSVSYDGLRWLHTGNVKPAGDGAGVYADAREVFQRTGDILTAAGMGWEHVVRTWWYLASITGADGHTQRYQGLNCARADAFARLHFGNSHMQVAPGHTGFPASTGIGMEPGAGLSLATLALQTQRSDVRLVPLENPLQTPAYDYAACYSVQSPKFSRAMALALPDYLTVWISGTASIMNSEVLYPGCVIGQTEQTLDNIAALIAAENLASHGVTGAGATLRDLAKVRVYVKRAADYAACRAVCRRRLGNIPAVYVVADVCRPELLVEIEGVAFARRTAPVSRF